MKLRAFIVVGLILAIGLPSFAQVRKTVEILRAASEASVTTAVVVTSAAYRSHSKAVIVLDVTLITTPDADDEIDFYIQTTYDDGTTWTDVENIHFALADNGNTALKVVGVGVIEFLAADTAIDSTDGSLADDTKLRLPFGSQIRITTVVAGATAPTYDFTASVELTR